jgi:cation diffusion facilitator CzcD-associated flavoprotein CzcO
LTIIDADSSVGGTWSASRIYPGLCADTASGAFEYADLSMEDALGIPKWSDITGDQSSTQVFREVCMQAWHSAMVQARNGRCSSYQTWLGLECFGATYGFRVIRCGRELQCDKLIVATGMTSRPTMPGIDSSNFRGRILHSKDFGKSHPFLTSGAVQNVTVVGGNKSSVEVARLYALTGKTVTWLIRTEDHGPNVMLDARRNGDHIGKISYTR